MTDKEILEECKDQRQACEVYDRVMGYLKPVSQWNIGKRQEFRDRKRFLNAFCDCTRESEQVAA